MTLHGAARFLRTRATRPEYVVQLGWLGTGLVLALLVGLQAHLYLSTSEVVSRAPEIRAALVRIGWLDHEATRATTMAVATDDSSWVARHDSAVRALARELGDLQRQQGLPFLREPLERISTLHAELTALEYVIIGTVADETRRQALDRLTGDEYIRRADALSASLLLANQRLTDYVFEQRRAYERTLLLSAGLLLLGAGLLLLLRRFTLRTVNRYVQEREASLKALRQARQQAEAANRAKSEFLSRTSHELRTPLNAILGFGQLLEMELNDQQNRESVDQILRSGRHLLSLVDEILDLAKIEAGEMRLAAEDVELDVEVRDAVQLVRPLAAERAVALHVIPPAGPGLSACCDAPRLRQVLLNLLSNAIKYNVAGGSVHVSIEPIGGDRVRISIRDTGIGISAQHLEQLFVPFYRGAADQSGIAGTGLGLSLSKGLVEAMGGVLSVESTEGQGSTFSVELPRGRELELPPAGGAETPPTGGRRTVLYIEDNAANQRLIERILARRGDVELITAMQGSLGLELGRRHPPTLVLLDLDLPDMGGEEVLFQIQSDPVLRKAPVLIISADSAESTRQRMLGLGAHAFLPKPVDVPLFLQVVSECLEQTGR